MENDTRVDDQTGIPPERATAAGNEPIRTHDVKIWPEYFAAVASGRKTFEIRKNDRGYLEGDGIILHEWDEGRGYSGASIQARIGVIVRAPHWGLDTGIVVFSLLGVSPANDAVARTALNQHDASTRAKSSSSPLVEAPTPEPHA